MNAIWNWKRLWRRDGLQPTAAGVIGKIPACPDFVREGGVGRGADALDGWLVAGRQALEMAQAGQDWSPVWFCVSPARDRTLLGVLAPSSDSAGRAFPVAVFQEVASQGLRVRFGELLWRYEAFFHAAETLIAQLPALSLEALREALDALPTMAIEAEPPSLLSQTNAASFLSGVFGAEAAEHYGLCTLLAAFDDAGADDLTPALECPIRDALDARIWLELAAQLARARVPLPGFFFRADPARLLLAPALPSPLLLAALVDPALGNDCLWPLTTDNREAADSARASLLQAIPELHMLTRGSVFGLWQHLAQAAPRLAGDSAGF